jgi:hypothetical protein
MLVFGQNGSGASSDADKTAVLTEFYREPVGSTGGQTGRFGFRPFSHPIVKKEWKR